MWKWQDAFLEAIKSLLTNTFQILELPIAFKVLAIKVPVTAKEDTCIEPITLIPENCSLNIGDFQQILAIAKHNFDHDPEQFFFRDSTQLNRIHRDSLYPKALRNAVQSILKQYDSQHQQASFCSFPIQKKNSWIMVIVQIAQSDFESQYRLSQQELEYGMRQQRLDRCFLEALLYRILKESELELQKPLETRIISLANSERVIEDAASSLLKSVELHITNWNSVDLLSFANAIAAERYEGAASEGRLIICATNHPDIVAKIQLHIPIEIYNYRGIRKLLEISSNQMALLCDVTTVWGLGIPLDTYQPSQENLFEIRFSEHHTWELVHAENIMLRVRYRQPRLPRARFERRLFYDYLYLLFQVNQTTANLLIQAVEAAVKQRHGTMLVITPNAASETKRLIAQSTAIEPVVASKEIISHLSSVDGAILLSPEGKIYSFGVILDGKASKHGNPSRGARYNSAIRYVDEQKQLQVNCLALIVSEDGYVDLYATNTNMTNH